MTSLGNYSFWTCKALNGEVNLQYVTSIGDASFAEDSSITGVTFSSNLTTIGEAAFWQCINLVGNIEIPETVLTVGRRCYKGTAITSLTFLGDSTEITPGKWTTSDGRGYRTLR